MLDYSPTHIWAVLTGELTDDLDSTIDVQLGLKRLPVGQAVFITCLASGYTGQQAMQAAGLSGNGTRLKRSVLLRLAKEINGE